MRKTQGTQLFCWEHIVFLGIGLDTSKRIALQNGSVHVQQLLTLVSLNSVNLHPQYDEDNLIHSQCTCHLTICRCPQTAIKNLEVQGL